MAREVVLGIAAFLLAVSAAHADEAIRFRDVTPETGITFKHSDGSSGRRYIVETVSAGLASFDFDRDGLIDIYFLGGTPLPGAPPDKAAHSALYKNMGQFRFADVTERAGVGNPGYAMGVAAADYDNDGWPDLYVSNFGPNVMYRNNGDGKFIDVTEKAGTAAGGKEKVGAGVAFIDIDNDGFVDLYVANYLRFSFEKHHTVRRRGVATYANQNNYPSLPDVLFRNQGDGTFRDVSRESGIADRPGWGMGIVAADYNNDGRSDLFVANDGMANFLLENQGGGKFREVGLPAGVGFDFQGNAQGSMGVDCGDYDNDGLLDFYKTAYQNQLATLYRNLGAGLFDDVTLTTRAGTGTSGNVTWGCALADFDNDGDRDLFVACGHLLDNVEQFDGTTSYHTRSIVLKNLLAETGQAKFVDVSKECGVGLLPKHSSRGIAVDDLDNDGKLDVVILNSREAPTVLRNMLSESAERNHWLQLRLQGKKSNRDGIGARVKIVAGGLMQVDEIHSGRGYQSHFGTRLHFGLGRRDRIDRIEIRWPGGNADLLTDLPADRLVTIVEGAHSR